MAETIDIAHVQAFYGNLIHLSQQKDHRMAGCYRYKDLRGESGNFDRLAQVDMAAYTGYHGNALVGDAEFSRRQVVAQNYEWGDIVDRKDIVRMLLDPTSDLVVAGAAAVNRNKDAIFRDAALGTTNVVDAAGAVTTPALAPGQIVDSAGAAGLTYDKIVEAKGLLDAVDAPFEDRFAIIGAYQLNTDLLNMPEATSSDYNPVHTLMEGRVAHWMGFKWIMYNDLDAPTSKRECIFGQKNGMGMALNEDYYHYVAPLPEKRNSYQVYVEMIGGCVRVEDELIVKVVCLES